MKRRIIKIDENKCNGCGLCAKACHEGAIGMVNGKAKLLRDDYCDGLGDCLPHCRPMPLLLKNGKPCLMTGKLLKQRCGLKENRFRPRGSALAPAYA